MIQAAINRGILVTVAVLITCILGVVAALNIPVQMIPDLEVRTITVQTGWPGATPQDVEKEILIEQERYLRSLANLKRMVSHAEMGGATIELEFPFGVEVNDALIRVNNALSQVPAYPENVDQPRLFSSSFSSNAFMYFVLRPLPGNPLQLDVDMLRDFAQDFVRPVMESVAGVSEVRVNGGAARQIRIEVDTAKLAQRGIPLTQIRDRIRSRNKDTSAGDLEQAENRFLLRVTGRFKNLNQLRELEIGRDGQTSIILKDVARVTLDHFEVRGKSYFDGERTLSLSVRRESGSNVLDIKRDMLPVVEAINQNLLQHNGLELRLTSDDVKYVKSSLENVWVNLAIGALLATGIMYLFLRSGRGTLIGVMGIPICTIAAFFALSMFNRTINVISLAGVAFAIGMTVDNSIVVLEAIMQAHRKGQSKREAAFNGVKEVWPAVLASTATTILVFAPILFIHQEAGQLYSDIAIAISGAILVSMLVAVFVVPVALANLGSSAQSVPGAQITYATFFLKCTAWFIRSRRQAGILAATIAAGTLGLALLLMPAAEYLPEGEEPKAFSMMIAPPHYNLSEMERIGEELKVYFDQYVNASPDQFAQGKTPMPPLAYYSMSVSVGRVWVLSAPVESEHINEMMKAITEKFKSYHNMRAFSARGSIISSNDGGTRAVAIDIAGNDLSKLYSAANAIYQGAEAHFDNPQINSDPGSLTLSQPMIRIQPRWQRLNELNFDNRDFAYSVAAFSDGAYVDEFLLQDNKVDIFLFSEAGSQQSPDQLAQTPILTPQGQILPLNGLADLIRSNNSNSLRRVDGKRTVTLYIIPPRNVALETAEAIVSQKLLPSLWQNGDIAQGIKVSISGAKGQLDATRSALSGNFLIALILSYLLLVAIFSHWRFPLFVLATIPLGMAGGLLGLVLSNGFNSVKALVGLNAVHQPFDMITMLGFLILLGTVVNNPILIVDQTRKNIQNLGLTVKQSVQQAVANRLTPILMSTSTTLFGLAPLVLLPGEGTELYRGVGIVVLSGILFSTVMTLTFLPALLVSVLNDSKKSGAAPHSQSDRY